MEYSTRAKKAFLGLVFGLLTAVAGTGQVVASTPDGTTPANEGVCDSLQGGTPGLYGLCVAYCEAQDLDTVDKNPPNTRILDNYRKKMQAGDPDMPCLQVPCPCVNDAELAAMTADGLGSCNRLLTNKLAFSDNGPLNFTDVDTSLGRERCRFVDTENAVTVRSYSITSEEAQSCYAAIDSACQSIGQ